MELYNEKCLQDDAHDVIRTRRARSGDSLPMIITILKRYEAIKLKDGESLDLYRWREILH
jgi:hypothetical protein